MRFKKSSQLPGAGRQGRGIIMEVTITSNKSAGSGTGNVNIIHIFPYNSKGIPSQMSTPDRPVLRWSKKAKIVSKYTKNAPLCSGTQNGVWCGVKW